MSHWYYSQWTDTGEYRIAPWRFGLMRAEKQQRREMTREGCEPMFQIRWVARRNSIMEWRDLTQGFYSLMASDRPLKRFVTWWRH